jgi:hypothetical protein
MGLLYLCVYGTVDTRLGGTNPCAHVIVYSQISDDMFDEA